MRMRTATITPFVCEFFPVSSKVLSPKSRVCISDFGLWTLDFGLWTFSPFSLLTFLLTILGTFLGAFAMAGVALGFELGAARREGTHLTHSHDHFHPFPDIHLGHLPH